MLDNVTHLAVFTKPPVHVPVKALHIVTSRGRIALLAFAAKAPAQGDLGFELPLQGLTQDVRDPSELERRKFPVARRLPNRFVGGPKKRGNFFDR